MMNGFMVKLVAVAVVLVGGFVLTSSLPQYDGERTSCQDCGSRGGIRKMALGNIDCYGCEHLEVDYGQKRVDSRILRSSTPRTPPAPAVNHSSNQEDQSPPPLS